MVLMRWQCWGKEVFSQTHTTSTLWITVKANDKQAARLENSRYVLNLLLYNVVTGFGFSSRRLLKNSRRFISAVGVSPG